MMSLGDETYGTTVVYVVRLDQDIVMWYMTMYISFFFLTDESFIWTRQKHLHTVSFYTGTFQIY